MTLGILSRTVGHPSSCQRTAWRRSTCASVSADVVSSWPMPPVASLSILNLLRSPEQQPEAVLFRIRDEGMGMPLEEAERIFEPFQRLHEIRAGGFGLGLATCRKIVECHGGRIWAESQQGRGTTFCFTLPRPPEA